jgi:hypothetical protein
MLQGNFVKIFNSTHSKMFFVLKFELILIVGSNNVLTEGARKVYRGRRVGQGCHRGSVGCGKSHALAEIRTSVFQYVFRHYTKLSWLLMKNCILVEHGMPMAGRPGGKEKVLKIINVLVEILDFLILNALNDFR